MLPNETRNKFHEMRSDNNPKSPTLFFQIPNATLKKIWPTVVCRQSPVVACKATTEATAI